MPSLDGYSLNEQIKRLRKDVFEELAKQREAFAELYSYISRFEKQRLDAEKSASKKKKTVTKKEVANA
jgi:hypothetical protein